jgi:hypothetical protein
MARSGSTQAKTSFKRLSGPIFIKNASTWPNWLPCVQTPFGGPLGIRLSAKPLTRFLEGTYVYPPDFDQATKEILLECTAIRLQIPKDLVNTTIMREDWGNHWGKAKEETPFPLSRRHLGHYKAGLRSGYISHLQALIATLTIRRGIVLDCWSQGLSVMLEKIFGCSLITKLQSILLMKADFNVTNKIVSGIRMLANACKY